MWWCELEAGEEAAAMEKGPLVGVTGSVETVDPY
jgi:hypothetical protein